MAAEVDASNAAPVPYARGPRPSDRSGMWLGWSLFSIAMEVAAAMVGVAHMLQASAIVQLVKADPDFMMPALIALVLTNLTVTFSAMLLLAIDRRKRRSVRRRAVVHLLAHSALGIVILAGLSSVVDDYIAVF